MPAAKFKGMPIPILNDLIYTILYRAPYAEKRGLKGVYLKAAMDEKAARSFSVNSSREEKEFILSHFGFEFCYVIYHNTLTFSKLKELFEKLNGDKKFLGLKNAAEEHLYVHSDKEFQRNLGVMAQHIHHPVYFLNTEILRQGYHIHNWAKNLNNEADLQVRQTNETLLHTAKFILNATLVLENIKAILGINEGELKVLLFLYHQTKSETNAEEVRAKFNGFFVPLKLAKVLASLRKGNFIIAIDRDKQTYYSIGSVGIRVINNYFNHVYNQNSF